MEERGFVSDDDVRKLMITLENIAPSDFSFTESDYAIAWYLNETANLGGYQNNILSNVVKGILNFDVFDKNAFIENQEKMDKTLARAQSKLAGKLAQVKISIFSDYKKICIDLFDEKNNANSSNPSVFASCRGGDYAILDKAFKDAILDIQGKLLPHTVGFSSPKKLLTNNEKRRIQDEINNLSSDKERIIAYQKSGLNKRRDLCEHYAVVDKKKFTTEVYDNDGHLVTVLDSIVGSNRKDNKKFNPDASLRLFSNGTYTRTTSAGIFHVMKIGDERKKEDYYKDEFNNKVIVLGKMVNAGAESVEEEEKILAIHGVPNDEWMGSDGKIKKLGNKKERMKSFAKGSDKRLSTGCINLEAYTFDVVEELVHAECPVYILPEDQNNYMYVKNYEINYSTTISERYSGLEHSLILKDGELVEDENNFNRYNYSSPLKKVLFTAIEGRDTKGLEAILLQKEKFLDEFSNLESDDLELSLSLVIGSGLAGEEAIAELRRINKYLDENKFNRKFQLFDSRAKKEEILSHIPHKERESIIEASEEIIFK